MTDYTMRPVCDLCVFVEVKWRGVGICLDRVGRGGSGRVEEENSVGRSEVEWNSEWKEREENIVKIELAGVLVRRRETSSLTCGSG